MVENLKRRTEQDIQCFSLYTDEESKTSNSLVNPANSIKGIIFSKENTLSLNECDAQSERGVNYPIKKKLIESIKRSKIDESKDLSTEENLLDKLKQVTKENESLRRKMLIASESMRVLETENQERQSKIDLLLRQQKRHTIKEEHFRRIEIENAVLNQKVETLESDNNELVLRNCLFEKMREESDMNVVLQAVCDENPGIEVDVREGEIVFYKNGEVLATLTQQNNEVSFIGSDNVSVLGTVAANKSLISKNSQLLRASLKSPMKKHFEPKNQVISITEELGDSLTFKFEFVKFGFEFLGKECNNTQKSKFKTFLKSYYKKDLFKTKLAIIHSKVAENKPIEEKEDKSCKNCDACIVF